MTIEFVIFLNCICVGIIVAIIVDLFYFFKRLFRNNIFVNVSFVGWDWMLA